MPNYNLTINSTFQPFTYQELTAPLDRMEQYHERLAQEYDNLSSQADVLEAMGSNDRDRNSPVYGRYRSYSDALRKEADELYRKGLGVESRQRLSDLRRRYNTEIVPIQNAWNKREEEAKAQQAAYNSNPNLRFTRDAARTSLQDYIDNPMGGYRTVNLDSIRNDMAAAAQTLAKQIRSGRTEGIDRFTAQHINQFGLDPSLIQEWASNPGVSPVLTDMMNQVLQKHGMTAEDLAGSDNMESLLRESADAARLGAWQAAGEDKAQMMELYGQRQAYASGLQEQREINVARAKAAMRGESDRRSPFSDSVYELPMQAATEGSSAKKATVRPLNYEKGDWNPTSKNYTVREIKRYKDDKPVFDTKTMSLGELLNRQDSNKKDINVSAFWGNIEGQEGIILATTEDSKAHRYFISADEMPEQNVNAARYYFNLAEQYRQRGMSEEQGEAIRIAMGALHTGLTMHNKSYEQSLVRQPSLKQQGLIDE